MTDFLLELRSEEIPARMQAGARADLEKLFRKEMDAAGVAVGAITVWSTPRRLALIARGLPEATAAVSEEVKGPRTSAPEQALEGFLRKTGLSKEQLTERDGVWFAVSEKPGRATREVLAEAIPAIVRAFPWPKSQRWGAASISTESLRWVRPLSGIVAIFGGDLVDCEVGGIRSGYATRGHRFHAPGEITIGGADDYADKLRLAHVIVNHEERQDLIRTRASEAAAAAGLTLVEDEGLVVENAGLTEWPVPLLGRFDEAFLDVPPEVIQLTARTNQKYFVCEKDGKLANAFVCTANIAAADGGEAIVAGNRKVLAARLSDARFFWEQDRKVSLSEHAKKLERITFHEKLGTLADKVERVAKLAEWLASEGIVPNCDPALARQAAHLCKADLVTEMVGEFPELQGLMGGYYARAEGLDDAVADAIRDHYKPVGQGDDVPTAPVTVAVSLADKLDTICVFFSIDEKPTGSKDPFALRRACLGAIELIVKNGLRRPVRELFADAYRAFSNQLCSQKFCISRSLVGDSSLGTRLRVDAAYLDDDTEILVLTRKPDFSPSNVSDAMVPAWNVDQVRKAGLIGYSVNSFVTANNEITEFFFDRLRDREKREGRRPDLIQSVLPEGDRIDRRGLSFSIDATESGQKHGARWMKFPNVRTSSDIVRILRLSAVLQSFIGTEDGANLLAGYKRAANILKKEGFSADRHPGLDPGSSLSAAGEGSGAPGQARGDEGALSYAAEPAEQALIDALSAAGPKAAAAIAAEDFAAAMAALSTLRAPIDAFFDQVTVNDADANKRAARLGLLANFRDAVQQVADFSRIEG